MANEDKKAPADAKKGPEWFAECHKATHAGYVATGIVGGAIGAIVDVPIAVVSFPYAAGVAYNTAKSTGSLKEGIKASLKFEGDVLDDAPKIGFAVTGLLGAAIGSLIDSQLPGCKVKLSDKDQKALSGVTHTPDAKHEGAAPALPVTASKDTRGRG